MIKSQPASSLLSLEAAEVLDRMREGADRMKNNTNSFLSGELVGLVPVRISVAAETEENSLRIRPIPRHPPHMLDGKFNFPISFNFKPIGFFSFDFVLHLILHILY